MVNNAIASISHFFAHNRSLSYLLLVTIFVFGVGAFWLMPKQYNPEIVRPAFVISFNYEGGTPKETLDRVGYELFEKLQIVPGVEDVYTKISDGAEVMSTVMFEVGYDTARAKTDLLTELESNSFLARGAVSDLSVQEVNPETIPVLQLVFSSDEATATEVREAVLQLREKILSVDAVSELMVVGGEGKSVMVEVDPVAMHDRGVVLADIRNALSAASLRIAMGDLEGETSSIKVVLDGQADSVSEIGSLPVTAEVLLREVATVYEGRNPHQSYTWYANKSIPPTEVVMLAVSKREGSSAPVVTGAVKAVIDDALATGDFGALSYAVISDDGVVASEEISGLTSNLMTSIVIVGIILFLFLSSRAALVVLITVPLTFLTVIGIGLVAGESMNRITLFALILSLGLLVDAAIVVVDNIFDHLKRAHEQGRVVSLPLVAAGAVKEVGVGLVLSALTSVVVFLPMNYITGMMGPYMGPIAFFVPLALIASLVIAIVLTPFISIKLLKHDEVDNRIGRFFKKQLERVTNQYVHLLHTIAYQEVFRRRLLKGVGLVFLISLTLPAIGLVHFQMLPKADRDQFYVYIDAPTGTSREETNEFAGNVADVLLDHPEIETVEAFVSGPPIVDFNGLFKGAPMRSKKEQATLRVDLSATDSRSISSTAIATEVRHEISERLGERATYVRIMEEPPGPPVAATFEAKVSADNPAVREQARVELRELIGRITGIVDEYTSVSAPVEEVVYTLDRELLRANGIAEGSVIDWYRLANTPMLETEYVAGASGERQGMYLTLPLDYRVSPAGLESIPLVSTTGETRFGAVTKRTYTLRTDTIYMEQARTVEYVTAEVEDRSIVYVMIELMRTIITDGLPSFTVSDWNLFGLTLTHEAGDEVVVTWGGEWEMTLENFRDLGLAMLVALFLVYAVLVAQYSSFSTPGFILVTIPLGLIGIFSGFLVLDQGFGVYLTATALIGFIALIGIVVNNAIIYLEYVEQALAEGTSYKDALIAAGAVRLRPILLTSLTTVLGSLTIASDPVWSGLAWSFVFGLSLSTVLTLIVLPAILLQFKGDDKIIT